MGKMNNDAKLTLPCINCDHLGVFHRKTVLRREKLSVDSEPCRKCKEIGKRKICSDFKPKKITNSRLN